MSSLKIAITWETVTNSLLEEAKAKDYCIKSKAAMKARAAQIHIQAAAQATQAEAQVAQVEAHAIQACAQAETQATQAHA